MRQSKKEFFHKGHGNQKRPSVVCDFRRIDQSKFADMSDDTKTNLREFAEEVLNSCRNFCNELKALAGPGEIREPIDVQGSETAVLNRTRVDTLTRSMRPPY